MTFEVYRDTVLIGSFSTDEMGQIRLTDLQPGTYLVKEVSTSAGYVLDSTPQQIELTAGGGIKTLTFFNTVKPGIHIIKADSRTMEPLTNVKFRISLVGGTFSKGICDRQERRDRPDRTGAGRVYRGGDHRAEWLSDG